LADGGGDPPAEDRRKPRKWNLGLCRSTLPSRLNRSISKSSEAERERRAPPERSERVYKG